MKHTYLLWLLCSATVAAQSIDYTLGFFDVNTAPAYYRSLQQTYEAPNGTYLQYGFGLNTAETDIGFFDGRTYTPRYTSGQPVQLVGATDDGAYALEAVATEPFGRYLLFIGPDGVDTLNQRLLNLPETFQLGETLLTFTDERGVIAYTPGGTETVLSSSYRDCNCNDVDRFFRLGDRLVYSDDGGYGITDGTPAGTARIFSGTGPLFALNGKVVEGSTLTLYDPATRTTTDLLQGLGTTQQSVATAVGVVAGGLVFTLNNGDNNQLLYVTDGTPAGTPPLPARSRRSVRSRCSNPLTTDRSAGASWPITTSCPSARRPG